mgnify:CR=1 FL=1
MYNYTFAESQMSLVVQVGWDDVGGLDDVKQRLKEAVERPFKNPDSLLQIGRAHV